MTDQQTTRGSHLAEAVTALLAAHDQLGDEALALLAAEKEDTPQGRKARRARTALRDAADMLLTTVQTLATVHGSTALGIDGAVSHNADGTPVTLLPMLSTQQSLLLDAWELVQDAVDHLDTKAFPAAKKNPAPAREPARTSGALLRLRDGVLALGRELDERGLGEDAAECQDSAHQLERLEARVCPPPDRTGPAPAEASVLQGAGR
ncbi:hypothetical protein ACFVUY_42820 [Kitasatospora sp. NPDC058063]|uniref:hypothetical protein n=1 Tax=unclassified Kitasatospora TaxID=2633591 RepID=UPI0036DC6891